MRRAGHPEAQAVAAALHNARKSGAHIPKKGKRRKQKKNANEAERQNG